MKLLFYQWNAFMQKGIEAAFKRLGIGYDIFYYVLKDWDNEPEFVEKLKKEIDVCGYDTVFSVNFAPVVADVCKEKGVHYISWVYDCPLHIRRTQTLLYDCVDVYFFDKMQQEKYKAMGAMGMHYLPLAVDTELFAFGADSFKCDVSLLGKLYNSDFNYLCTPLKDYYRGYLDGIVRTQMNLSGGYIINEMITDELIDKLNEQYLKASGGTFSIKPEELEFTLASEATGRQRYMALALLQSRYDVHLYSGDKLDGLPKLKQLGYADYYKKMPEIFKTSRINLNISLSAIQSGIPLRVVDILGSGGFCLTNVQPEIMEYFTPDVDIAVYYDIRDLVDKVKFYLENDSARMSVVKNGYERVRKDFNFDDRVRTLFSGTRYLL